MLVRGRREQAGQGVLKRPPVRWPPREVGATPAGSRLRREDDLQPNRVAECPDQPPHHLLPVGHPQRDGGDAPPVIPPAVGCQGLIIQNGPDELQDLLLTSL